MGLIILNKFHKNLNNKDFLKKNAKSNIISNTYLKMSSTNLFTVLDPENQPPKQEVKHQEPPKHEEPVKHQDPPKHHDVPHEKEHSKFY